eukprot:jgi/Astpho2/9687/Aster-08406
MMAANPRAADLGTSAIAIASEATQAMAPASGGGVKFNFKTTYKKLPGLGRT